MAKAVVKKKGTSRQRSQRKKPDLDAIIEVAIELVLRHGDSGFRIEELIERTGISKSSLYLHFGDRDGLVGLALSTAFLRDIRNNVDDAAVLLADVKNRKQMEEAIPQLVELALNTPDVSRWQRVMVLAIPVPIALPVVPSALVVLLHHATTDEWSLGAASRYLHVVPQSESVDVKFVAET